MAQQSPSRFRFRFQTMIVIFTAIAIFLGLFLREVQHERCKKQIIEAIKKDGGHARLVDPMRNGQASKGFFKDWIRIFLGDDYFTVVPSLGIKSGSASLDEVVGYFPELQSISIGDVTEKVSLDQLPKLSKLNDVLIYKSEITDSGLDSLSKIESMRHLRFHECSLKDCSGAHLASCPRLQSVSFEKTELSSQVLSSLQATSSLSQVRFVDCQIDDSLLKLLHGSVNKVDLQLNYCKVTEHGILSLRQANPDWKVQCYDVSDTKFASQDDLNIYPRLNEVPEVIKLTFAGNLVTDATLIALTDTVKLQELSVTHTARGSISAKGIEALQGLKNLNSLHLSFTGCTDVEVIAIAKLARLESLSLWGCPVADASVEELAKLKSLKRLFVVETAISESGMERLRLALPNCEIVSKFE